MIIIQLVFLLPLYVDLISNINFSINQYIPANIPELIRKREIQSGSLIVNPLGTKNLFLRIQVLQLFPFEIVNTVSFQEFHFELLSSISFQNTVVIFYKNSCCKKYRLY